MAGLEPVAADVVGGQRGHCFLEVGGRARQHGVGAVVGGHRERRNVVDHGLDPVRGGEDRRHPTAGGQTAEELAAQRHQPCAGSEVEHTGHAGGGVLPDTVAEHDIGLQTPRLPESSQPHFHREQCGLRIARLPQGVLGLRTVGLERDVEKWGVEQIGDGVGARVDRRGEHRFRVVQPARHAGVLTALAGEQPGRLRDVVGLATDQSRCGPVVGDGVQQFECAVAGVGHQGGPVLGVRAGHSRGEADVGQRGLGVCGPPVAVCAGERTQRGGRLGGQRQQLRTLRRLLDVAGCGQGRLFEDDVGVGAGEAERTHPGDARPVCPVPGPGLGEHLHGEPMPRNVRRRVLEVEVPGQGFVFEGEDHLDDARDAGGGLEMSDVGLGRADQQGTVRLAALTECGAGGLRLDRITERGARAVGFEVVDVARGDAGAAQRGTDHALLGDAVGHGQTARCAVLIDRAAADHRADVVAVAHRVLEPLDDDDAAALAAHVAVGGRVEGLAPAVGRQHVGVGERDHRGRRQQHVRAAGQRQVALAELQCLAGLVDRDQRRAAGGVDGHGRSLQAQPVADPPCRSGIRRPDGHVGLDLGIVQLIGHDAQVVVGREADEHAGVAARQRRRRDAGVLERMPRGLQEQAVLRVHLPHFTGGHAEERRVESGDVVDEPGPPGRDLARRARLGVVEGLGVPAVSRHLGNGVAALAQQVPERVGVRRSW